MFDFGFNELLLLSILIIVFFGPKELPVVLRAIHNFFSKLWVYSKEIRTSIESLVDDVDISRQAEMMFDAMKVLFIENKKFAYMSSLDLRSFSKDGFTLTPMA